MPTLDLPTADGTIQRYTTGQPRHFPDRSNVPFNRIALAAAHVVADPRAEHDPGSIPPSTGTAPSPSAPACGTWDWAWPRRWTPPSAAWGSTGRPLWN